MSNQDKKWVAPRLSGFIPSVLPRYCGTCRFNKGLPAPAPQLRRLELARQGIPLPPDIPFNAEVLMKCDLPRDGAQVYFIGEREGAYARFLPEKYQCYGTSCESNIYALTLVRADVAHPLHSVYKPTGMNKGAVEVEIREVIRTDGKSRYRRGTSEDQIVRYLRSKFGEIGYRPRT